MNEKARVLIVDDEPDIGNLLKDFLEEDFDVVTFTDPRLACDEITKVPYNLLISDIKMPYVTGWDMVKHVKTVRPSTHIVLITGHATTDRDRAEAHRLGASGLLSKPFSDPSKLVEFLSGVLSSAPSVTAVTSKGSKPEVLIVDDEPDLADVLKMILEDEFVPVVCNNPLDALKVIENGHFQMILTDLNMPQMRGVDLIRQIRSLKPEVSIVIMTGHGANEPEVADALRAGGKALLPKPFPDPEIILEQLKKIMK